MVSEEEESPRQPIIESVPDTPNVENNTIEKLRSYGLDLTKIEKNDKDIALNILNEAEENTITRNLELLKNINVSEEAIYKVYEGEGDK
jgi:hypothetical protein